MAVDMGSGSGGGFTSWLDKNPTIALGGVLVVVLLGGAVLLKKKTGLPGTGTATPQTQSDLSGLSTNASGQPIVYVPTQTQFSTYNATDASQHVSNTGQGNVTTGSSSAGNTQYPGSTTKPPVVLHHPLQPVRKPPVSPPAKVSMQWNQHYSTMGQSLDTVAFNATSAMNAEAGKDHVNTRFSITGQQIYNQNKDAVDSFFALHKLKTSKTSTATTGMAIIIAHLVKG